VLRRKLGTVDPRQGVPRVSLLTAATLTLLVSIVDGHPVRAGGSQHAGEEIVGLVSLAAGVLVLIARGVEGSAMA
jgi:hypothetical protein